MNLKWMCFNAQSCRRIVNDLSEIIIENNLDILMLTETWLYEQGGEAYITAMTPPGYTCHSFPRRARGGDIAFIIKACLSENITCTCLDYTSFESVELKVTINQTSAILVWLYRLHPGQYHIKHVTKHVNFPTFLSELNDILPSYAMTKTDVSLFGDFNLHFDELHESRVKRTNDILVDFGYSQLVDNPTHILNHILDWVVVRSDKTLIVYDDVIRYPGLSDHYAVIGYLKIVRPTPFKHLVTSRILRAIDPDRLQSDIADWSSDVLKNQHDRDVCGLVDIYNEGLDQILKSTCPSVYT